MAKKEENPAFIRAWVHYWRKDWYINILKNCGLWQKLNP